MIWPDLPADDVLAAVRERWDLSGPLPVPKGEWLACPVCRAGQPQPRYWRWHKRHSTATLTGRCDVAFKCTSCSVVWTHGVAVDSEYFRRHAVKLGRMIHWREARTILEG